MNSRNERRVRIALAQRNFIVGDLAGNAAKIIADAAQARDKLQADLIVFPQLALSGYPPDDLLCNQDFIRQLAPTVRHIAANLNGIAAIIGAPYLTAHGLSNAAIYIADGEICQHYDKQLLGQERYFREQDYFNPGTTAGSVEINGIRIALSIGAEILQREWLLPAAAQLVLNLNAIPYCAGTHQQDLEQLVQRRLNLPLLQVNLVGAQDELVFAGHSLLLGADGALLYRAAFFHEELAVLDLYCKDEQLLAAPSTIAPALELEAEIYQALVLGLRDYVEKNRFPGLVFGLSGGLDSALVLALAVDAIGAQRVEVALLPSRYTADISNIDAIQQAQMLGVRYHILPIEPAFQTFLAMLQPLFAGLPADTAEENIQARCRGLLLMGIANKTGKVLLATSNKSETAVGYATLYGDMAGGFAPLKDVYKTMVYRLAHWRNRQAPAIPQRVLERPPSAELRPNQTDQDSLPPYPLLDALVQAYVEQGQSVAQLIAAGYDKETVQRVVQLLLHNEYKHRQAASGVRISRHPFGSGRRYPLSARYAWLAAPAN